jgi:hypothetical protein
VFALTVLTEQAFPHHHEIVARNLARARRLLEEVEGNDSSVVGRG